MLSNIEVDKEVFTFNFKDSYPGILNGTVRILTEPLPIYVMQLEKSSGFTQFLRFEELELMLRYMYINHSKLRTYITDNIFKIEFSLEIEATDYMMVYSNKIVFRLNGKVIESPIRSDLYILTMSKDEKISFSGKLVKKPIKIIASYGYSYDRQKLDEENKFIAKAYMAVLEIYPFNDLIMIGLVHLQTHITNFKDAISTIKTTIIASNIKKYMTEDYDNSIFVLLSDHINLKYKTSELCAIYDRQHMSENLYTLTISSKKYNNTEFDQLLIDSLLEIVTKIKLIIISVGDQIDKHKNKKELTTVNDNY